ncbi:unnamed protein product [Calypogeia fissa]
MKTGRCNEFRNFGDRGEITKLPLGSGQTLAVSESWTPRATQVELNHFHGREWSKTRGFDRQALPDRGLPGCPGNIFRPVYPDHRTGHHNYTFPVGLLGCPPVGRNERRVPRIRVAGGRDGGYESIMRPPSSFP